MIRLIEGDFRSLDYSSQPGRETGSVEGPGLRSVLGSHEEGNPDRGLGATTYV